MFLLDDVLLLSGKFGQNNVTYREKALPFGVLWLLFRTLSYPEVATLFSQDGIFTLWIILTCLRHWSVPYGLFANNLHQRSVHGVLSLHVSPLVIPTSCFIITCFATSNLYPADRSNISLPTIGSYLADRIDESTCGKGKSTIYRRPLRKSGANVTRIKTMSTAPITRMLHYYVLFQDITPFCMGKKRLKSRSQQIVSQGAIPEWISIPNHTNEVIITSADISCWIMIR